MSVDLGDIMNNADFVGLGEQVAGIVASVFAVIAAVFLIVGIVFFILRAVALFNLGRDRGVPLYGLAWVPIANNWVLGGIADAHDKYDGRDYKWRHILLWISVGLLAAAGFAVLLFFRNIGAVMSGFASTEDIEGAIMSVSAVFGSLSSLWSVFAAAISAYSVCRCIAYFKLFESTSPNNCVILLIVSVAIPIAEPIILMCVRHKNADAEAEYAQPVIPAYHTQPEGEQQ